MWQEKMHDTFVDEDIEVGALGVDEQVLLERPQRVAK